MSEKINQAVSIATEIAKETANSPKFSVVLSAWIISINWVDVIPVAVKMVTTIGALVVLILLIGNHWLTRKKLKLEIAQLKTLGDEK